MAPEISLLEPQVLQGVISKMEVKDDLVFLKSAPKESVPFPFYAWEVTKGGRRMANPNVPNSEAHIVPRYGSGHQNAALIYLREKKIFDPTTLHWLKDSESNPTIRANAEARVLRELEDLNNRFDVFWEYCFWQAFQGELNFDGTGGVKAQVDYLMPASHKTTADWSAPAIRLQEIVANFAAWRNLIRVDGNVDARKVYATSATLGKLMETFTSSTNQTLLSDRMKDEWFGTGEVKGFLGLDWTPMDAQYTDASGTVVNFLDDDVILLGNWTEGRPYAMVSGPAADHDAPHGFTGRFTKSWIEPDPSHRQILLEQAGLPVVYKPENFVKVAVTF